MHTIAGTLPKGDLQLMNAIARTACAAYQKQEVENLKPVEIVHRLYQQMHRKLLEAKEAILAGQTAARGESLGWALAIVGELQASLNMEEGGEIAANLNDLYYYLTREITLAGVHNDADRLNGALRTIEPLVEAWEEAAKGERAAVKTVSGGKTVAGALSSAAGRQPASFSCHLY